MHQMRGTLGHKVCWEYWKVSIRVIEKKYLPKKYFSKYALRLPSSMSTLEFIYTKEQQNILGHQPQSYCTRGVRPNRRDRRQGVGRKPQA